jgi:8-oxo-dGTP diphosphatase
MAKRKLAGSAVVFDKQGRVLLVRQGSKKRGWELPGGKVKKREALPDGVVREVEEETGIRVTPLRLVGIFFVRKEVFYDFIVACELDGKPGKPRPCPPEIIDCGFFHLNNLPEPIRPYTVQRIQDALTGVCHPLPVEISRKQWLG